MFGDEWFSFFNLLKHVLRFQKICSSEASVGHSYNLIETRTRRIVNVETASRNRTSVYEIGETPYFHANMYLHLQVQQVSKMFIQIELYEARSSLGLPLSFKICVRARVFN